MSGAAHDQRDVQRGLVGEQSVRQLAVLAAPLAVIAGDDDERVIDDRPELLAQHVVNVRDLAEVEIGGVLRCEWLGRAVGGVGVVHVHPHEPFLSLVGLPPPDRGLEHRCGRPLLQLEIKRYGAFAVVVVVDLEALIEAVARVERRGADERAGRVAQAAQHRRNGLVLRVESKPGVLAHAVLIGIEPGQDVGVRRQGDDVLRVRVGEDDPFGRHAIEERRLHARVAGETDGIRAPGVDGDEDDVFRGLARWFRVMTAEQRQKDQHVDRWQLAVGRPSRPEVAANSQQPTANGLHPRRSD